MNQSAGFVLDLSRCVGCGACVVACRIENQVPAALSWRRIVPLNLSRYSGAPSYFLSLACHHCENPPCARGCPSGALEKRDDGVVVLHSDRCIGCRYCEMACSFGAPAFDGQEGVMTKCHLCYHRLDDGRLPACVSACPTKALRYGCPKPEDADRFVEADAVPGFVDPGKVRPGLRFGLPGGEIRSRRYTSLLDALEKAGVTGGPGGAGGSHGQ